MSKTHKAILTKAKKRIKETWQVPVPDLKRTRNSLLVLLFMLVWLPVVLIFGVISYSFCQQVDDAESKLLQAAMLPEYNNMLYVADESIPMPEFDKSKVDIDTLANRTEFQSISTVAVDYLIRDSDITVTVVASMDDSLEIDPDTSSGIVNLVEGLERKPLQTDSISLDRYEISGRKWIFGQTGTVYLADPNTIEAIEGDSLSRLVIIGGILEKPIALRYVYVFLDVTEMEALKYKVILFDQGITILLIPSLFLACLWLANRLIKPSLLAWDKQRSFIAVASHEIKTPLSIIRTNYDALIANQDETVASQRLWLDSIDIGIDRLTRLCDLLLRSAKLDNSTEVYAPEKLDISSYIESSLFRYHVIVQSKNLVLTTEISPSITFSTNKDLLDSAIQPVLENAFKYVEPRGDVRIKQYQIGEDVYIEISNSGPGISANALPHIFEPFYQSDDARANKAEISYGLGLSISKQAIESLGGSITISSSPGETTTCIVHLKPVSDKKNQF